MTAWTPVWRVRANGDTVTGVTLANLTITSGRTDINSPTPAGYCSLQLINTDNSVYNFAVNTSILIEVQDSNADYVPLFGGRISDIRQIVTSAGSQAAVTTINITATGALIRLQRATFDGNLAEGLDGAQITDLLDDLLLASWNELPPAETWASYDPATETWAEAGDIGLGSIDAGEYTMASRQITDQVISNVANQIASSALGYLYEDANGNINYADASHRQDYLVANGYTDLDAAHAIGAGIGIVQRQGDIANKIIIDYGNNFNSQYIAQDTDSQATYGLYAEQFSSYLKNTSDVEDMGDRLIQLRAYPRYLFQSITFPLQNPEIDDADRDALLNIFMGQPVRITNLPPQMLGGEFTGYVEGWTFRASVGGLSITFNASPTEFSAVAQQWAQVNAAESWNSVLNTLEWQDAIGVIS
jgi:hypothetical protein